MTGGRLYTGGLSRSYRCLALAGVSSTAPSATQRVMSAICSAGNGSAFCGISASPLIGVMSVINSLSSGLTGTIAFSPLSPPLSSASKRVIT